MENEILKFHDFPGLESHGKLFGRLFIADVKAKTKKDRDTQLNVANEAIMVDTRACVCWTELHLMVKNITKNKNSFENFQKWQLKTKVMEKVAESRSKEYEPWLVFSPRLYEPPW